MNLHTINQWLDKLYTYYSFDERRDNNDLVTLEYKLLNAKREYGGNLLAEPGKELKKLIELYLDKDTL